MSNHRQQSTNSNGRRASSRGAAASRNRKNGTGKDTRLSQGADNYGSSDADRSDDDEYRHDYGQGMRGGAMDGAARGDREQDGETDWQAASRDRRPGHGGHDWRGGSGEGYGRDGREAYGGPWNDDRGGNGRGRTMSGRDGRDTSYGYGSTRGDWADDGDRDRGWSGRERGMNGNTGREGYGSSGWERAARQESDRGWREDGHAAMASARGLHAGKGPKGYRRSDERLQEDVSDRLMRHGDVDASDIEVRVQHGEVTLDGTVPDREMKRRAEECLDDCPGVSHVQNNLRWHQGAGAGHGEGDAAAGRTGKASGATGGRKSRGARL